MTHSLDTRFAQRTSPVLLVRRGLVALTGIGILATAFELAAERHWGHVEQLVPWLALVLLAIAVGLTLLPDGRGTTAARVLAVVVLGASAYGVIEHVLVNAGAGRFDPRLGDVWASLPLLERGWYALTKTVGSAPTLAPGVLAQTALLLLLATVCRAGTGSGSSPVTAGTAPNGH
ncbi:MAG TPA: hypothetical protein VKZ81_11655 [Pseudonocardia sp.]|jgi:hypothetical protein|uniref:hypothetical protein n=1 Tax=Pseudonocardia sp. TaxID=60912 RepID=UPI002B4B84C5|nr:hypothetical protein [Pseudonocardia sp.]HLU56108.1 hypothetical protein [Pseudonocardia sp.]